MNNIPMSISVNSEYFDTQSDEKYDEISSRALGVLQKKDKQYRIIYKERANDTDLTTELIFSEGEGSLTVTKRGEAECQMLFCESKRSSFIYRLAYASFDAEITTHSLTNTISVSGGEICVSYTLSLGGQSQKISMKISAEAIK